jgi:hypothetical protein
MLWSAGDPTATSVLLSRSLKPALTLGDAKTPLLLLEATERGLQGLAHHSFAARREQGQLTAGRVWKETHRALGLQVAASMKTEGRNSGFRKNNLEPNSWHDSLNDHRHESHSKATLA